MNSGPGALLSLACVLGHFILVLTSSMFTMPRFFQNKVRSIESEV